MLNQVATVAINTLILKNLKLIFFDIIIIFIFKIIFKRHNDW